MKGVLYRHYDSAGRLLYIGQTVSAFGRMMAHVHGSAWAEQIAKITLEHFQCRGEARCAEAEAIEAEKPLYNKQHTYTWE